MKRTLIALVLLLAGCGRSSVDNEMIGQVKKVASQTPLICPPFKAIDLSLGVMRNGVGSMSHEDVWLYVASDTMYDELAKAVESGALVRVHYDVYRLAFCTPDHWATRFEIIKDKQ